MAEAPRDQNHVPTALAVSSVDGVTTLPFKEDPLTGRVLVDSASGSGTVTTVSIVTANGFAGTVATPTTTPVITLTTTVTGILKGDGTTISAATAGTDYVTASSTNTFTNKTFDTAGTGNSFSVNGNAITAVSGTGSTVALSVAPTFTGVTTMATGSATILQAPTVRGGSNSNSVLTIESTSVTGTSDSIVFKTGSQVTALTISTAQLATFAGHLVVEGVTSTGATGTGAFVFGTSPALVATAQTGISTADLVTPNNHAITVTTNAGSASQSFLLNTFTNSSAATMAITIPVATPTPKDGQFLEVRIYDFSAVAQTIGWTGTENSTVTVPTTSNGSTTLPLSVLFQFNAATTKWRCVATA